LQAAEVYVSHNKNFKVKGYLDDNGYSDDIWDTIVEKINVT
jgi:hypothetical protein